MNEPSDETINKRLAEFMEVEDFCLCLVTHICPSPSAHHDHCLNEDCGKLITKLSYDPYTSSMDQLIPVVEKLKLFFIGLYKYPNCWYGKVGINSILGDANDKSPSRALALAIYEVIKNG